MAPRRRDHSLPLSARHGSTRHTRSRPHCQLNSQHARRQSSPVHFTAFCMGTLHRPRGRGLSRRPLTSACTRVERHAAGERSASTASYASCRAAFLLHAVLWCLTPTPPRLHFSVLCAPLSYVSEHAFQEVHRKSESFLACAAKCFPLVKPMRVGVITETGLGFLTR